MARIRTVKPEFFKHLDLYLAEKESGLPLRLGFQGLWLLCDKQGAFRWQPQVLKLDILPYDEIDFKRVLETLLNHGFIGKYVATDGKHYGIIPTFPDHQRITGNEATKPPLYPSPPTDYKLETLRNHLGNNDETVGTTGREGNRKGIGKEGKGDSYLDSGEVIFDIEKYLVENRIHLEAVCMNAKKTEQEVMNVLKKYHLWNQENEKYPKKPISLIAGLQKWLLNEQYASSNGHDQIKKEFNQAPPLTKLK